MKRIVVLAAIVFLAFAPAVAADEMTEVYRLIYMQSEGLQQKYAALLNLIELGDREIAPILGEALEELLRTQRNYESSSDKELFARSVRACAKALGEFKHEESAAFLWDAVQQVGDPLTKAEALMAIGRMRAFDFSERIALLLRDLNLKPTADTDSGEKTAFGAIIALEKLKDPIGFSPVFFAGDAWYSQRVRQQADRSLPNIAADPTDLVKDILKVETPDRRLRALKLESASGAGTERKIETAVLALELGHKQIPRDKTEARVAADVRKYALKMLFAYKAKSATMVSVGIASYENGFDDEEKLLGLAALGANGTDPAAIALRDIIIRLNQDVRNGAGDETKTRMAKAAIENAGSTKNKIVKTALILVASNDKWSNSVITAAQLAAKEIP